MRLEVWDGSVWIRSGTGAHGGGEGHVVYLWSCPLGRRSLHCVLSAVGQSHWGLRHVGQVAVSVYSDCGEDPSGRRKSPAQWVSVSVTPLLPVALWSYHE